MWMLDSVCSNIKWNRKCLSLFIIYGAQSKYGYACILKTVQQTILAIRKKNGKHKSVLTLLDTI